MADSGASVNVLDKKDYRALTKPPVFQHTKVKIHPYKSSESLAVLGKFTTVLKFKSTCIRGKIYVVQGSGGSLLSWKTSQDLGLLKTVHRVHEDSPSRVEKLVKEYDELFHGLDKLKGYQVKLHIDESVQPVAQPHRRVPFHVRQQLEEQLKRDEDLGVLERIEGPTPWVSPIVVAPKPKSPGQVRVCVGMRQANQAIKRERHVTPTIKEIIGDLNGAKVFSKLDLNQGYNQLELAPESRYITTFGTHLGLMRYKSLNFGISNAAEIFQNVIRETLEGIPGALNISDDILVFGKTQSAHDHALEAVFQRLKERRLTLNKSKCEYSKDKVGFFGYVFSGDGIAPDPKEDRRHHQPANTHICIRGSKPVGNDQLLFQVYSRLCHQDRTTTQAYPQRSKSTCHSVLRSSQGYRTRGRCHPCWLSSHSLAERSRNRKYPHHHLCQSFLDRDRTAL